MVGIRSALFAAACAVAVSLGANSGAGAAVYHPVTVELTGWTATPGYIDSWYSNLANADIGNQSPVNVEEKLETLPWLNIPLTFVQGGACETNGVACVEDTKSGTYTGLGANVFGIHFGNKFLALLYDTALLNFFITGLPHGVSNIYAFCSLESCGPTPATGHTPIPAPFFLMGTVLAGTYLVGRWRKRRVRASASAA